jgi:hypothetical protein
MRGPAAAARRGHFPPTGPCAPPGIPDENFELNDLSARGLMTRAPGDVAAALNREAAPKGSGFAEDTIMVAAQLGALDQAFEVADAYCLDRGFQVGPAGSLRSRASTPTMAAA